MTKPVAIYLRSSKDRHDVSCEAQEEEIRKVVRQNGEEVYQVFADKALSSTRDVRPAFDEMIALALSKNPPFGKIYCLDTSRFGRDQHHTQALLWELRKKRGVEVVFTTMPQTGSYLDPAFEAIMSAFDYIHSQQSKVKGVASMKQNILQGFRAGGRAPYGYRLKKVELGTRRDGQDIVKTRLEPDPETSPVLREYFERRVRGEARRAILDDFYRRGIPSPSGLRRWPISSAKSMEDNVEVYLGHLIFNRLNERVKVQGKCEGYLHGEKWKPEEEWVVTLNTHEPLITEQIAAKIREIKAKGIRDAPYQAKRVYALSGTMKCAQCGENYTGDSGIYRCSARKRVGEKCPNNDIAQGKVEDAIFSVVDQQILNFKNISALIKRVKSRFHTDKSEIRLLKSRLAQVDNEIRKVMKLYRLDAIDEREIEIEMQELQEQKKVLLVSLEDALAMQRGLEVSNDEIIQVIENFREEVRHADPRTRKRAVQTLFDNIRIHPKKGDPWQRMLEVRGTKVPLTGVNVASPRGHQTNYEKFKLLISLDF